MWLERWIRRRSVGAPSGQLARVQDVLYKEGIYDDYGAFAAALAEAAGGSGALEPAALSAVVRAVRARYLEAADDAVTHEQLWRELAARLPADAAVVACHGEALVSVGRRREGVERLIDAAEREPTLLAEFGDELEPLAEELGGLVAVRHRVARLRWLLAAPDEHELDELADEIREQYAELVDRHAEDPAAMARIRPIGQLIRACEEQGRLPRAFVRRTRPR